MRIDCRGQGRKQEREDGDLEQDGSRGHGTKRFNDVFFLEVASSLFAVGLGEAAYLHMGGKDSRRGKSSWRPVCVTGGIEGPVEADFREKPGGS